MTRDPQGVTRGRWRGRPARGLFYKERPKDQWISVPVPALITEEMFDLAQERLQKNKHFSARNTKNPSLLQGLLVCALCGYAVYKVGGPKIPKVTGKKVFYYRCSCSERYKTCLLYTSSLPLLLAITVVIKI